MNRFGELLREARKSAGLTQQEIADKVGVDDSYISKMEKGVFEPPSREVALGLADALGLSNKGGRKRIEFLFAAGVASGEDLEEFALVKLKDDERLGSGQSSQETSAPDTAYHSQLFISFQEVLVRQLAVLKKKVEVAEKNVREVNEELQELTALVEELFSKEEE
jgi:transcriptional regulator with XRE-family HTH domain